MENLYNPIQGTKFEFNGKKYISRGIWNPDCKSFMYSNKDGMWTTTIQKFNDLLSSGDIKIID